MAKTKLAQKSHICSILELSYLPFNSNHPKPCLKSIPFSLKNMCSIKNAKVTRAKFSESRTVLRNQKYPSKIVVAGIKKARKIRVEVETNIWETPILPLVSTFYPNNNYVFPTIKNNIKNAWNINESYFWGLQTY